MCIIIQNTIETKDHWGWISFLPYTISTLICIYNHTSAEIAMHIRTTRNLRQMEKILYFIDIIILLPLAPMKNVHRIKPARYTGFKLKQISKFQQMKW